MGKSILDFTSISGRSGTEFTQVKGRSGTVFWCKPYILTLSSKPTGVDTITCYRYSSVQPGAATGPSAVLTNGSTIYHGDVIYISATASSGYKAPSVSSSTGTISSNKLPVDGNESITVTAGELDVAPVYITAGTGVSSVFLSASSVGTGPEPAGSNFNIGSTVYGFAVLQTGYNPGSGWTLVSGSTYRVGSITVAVSGNDFGTINSGGRKSYTVTWKWYSSNTPFATENTATQTYYYGDTPSRSSPGNVEDDPYSRTFTGWDNLNPITSDRTIQAQYSTTEKLYDIKLTYADEHPFSILNYGWTRGSLDPVQSGVRRGRTIRAPYYAKMWCSGNYDGYNIDFYVGTAVGSMQYCFNTTDYDLDPYVNALVIYYHYIYQGIRISTGQSISDGTIIRKGGFNVVPWYGHSNKPYGIKINLQVNKIFWSLMWTVKVSSISGYTSRNTYFYIESSDKSYHSDIKFATADGESVSAYTDSTASLRVVICTNNGDVIYRCPSLVSVGKSTDITLYSMTNSDYDWRV